MSRLHRSLLTSLLGLLIPGLVLAQGQVQTPRVHALTNVQIWQSPGRTIENGTVVIRDGVIEAVGADVTIPADARVWESDSLMVYPGLIDLGMMVSPPRKGGDGDDDKKDAGPNLTHPLDVITPELVLADVAAIKESDLSGRRGQGITTVRALPKNGAIRGQAAILNLGDGDMAGNLLRREAGQVLAFSTARGKYPGSVMGVVAAMRQTFYDTRWYDQAHATYASNPVGMERPAVSTAYAAMSPALNGNVPMIFVTRNVLDLLRAGEMAREFDVTFDFVGSGEEYRRIDEIKPFARNLVVPVAFPEAPSIGGAGASLDVSLEQLRAWDKAPGNLAQLHNAGIAFAITADGQKDMGKFLKNVAKAIEAGLPADAAFASLTTVPAGMIGMSDRMGTVDRGKMANLVVADGDLFADDTKIRSVWVDGTRYEVEEIKPPKGDPTGTWDLVAVDPGGMEYPFTLILTGDSGDLEGKMSLMGNEIPAEVSQSGSKVIVSFSAAAIGMEGSIRFSFEFTGDSATGSGKIPDGSGFSLTGTRSAKPEGRAGGAN